MKKSVSVFLSILLTMSLFVFTVNASEVDTSDYEETIITGQLTDEEISNYNLLENKNYGLDIVDPSNSIMTRDKYIPNKEYRLGQYNFSGTTVTNQALYTNYYFCSTKVRVRVNNYSSTNLTASLKTRFTTYRKVTIPPRGYTEYEVGNINRSHMIYILFTGMPRSFDGWIKAA